MKKILLILTLLFLCLACCACKSSSAPQAKDPAFLVSKTTAPSVETTAPTEFPTELPTEPDPTSTTQSTNAEGLLPIGQDGMVLWFSSGAGAWRTELTLHADGSFAGQFTDTDMGVTGEGYPHGTVYTSDFFGSFQDIERINDHSYKMTLSYVQTLELPGEEWIQDDVRYIASEAYGLDNGREFVFYLPDTPLEGLSEEFLIWWPHRFDSENRSTLGCYGLENCAEGYGFFYGD